eukprot:g1926.t1
MHPHHLGIVLGLIACVLNATGMNFQKIGQQNGRGYVTIFGLILSAIAGISDVSSFSFAPQSLLAPLGAITLVCNLLVAPLIDAKEKLTKIDILATTIISAGVVGCVSASLGDNEKSSTAPFRNLKDLEETITRPVALQFICAVQALLAILFISMFRLEKTLDSSSSPGLRGAIYPIISGLLACLTVTSAKFAGEVTKLNDESSTWLLVCGWGMVAGGAVMNTYMMNRGFSKGISSLFAVPVMSGCAVVFNTLSGAFFFGESSTFTAYQWKAIPISVGIVLLGISVLLSKSTDDSSMESDAKKKKDQ